MSQTERPYIREFFFDGKQSEDTTYRTPMVKHFVNLSGKTFFDPGTCDGCEGRSLAIHGAKKVTSVEGKMKYLEQAIAARDYYKVHNQELIQGDVRVMDENTFGLFDYTICFGLLYHMENPFNFLKRMNRVTKDSMFLETHVAPHNWLILNRKIQRLIDTNRYMKVRMDAEDFECVEVTQGGKHPSLNKGNLDSFNTYWLTKSSLDKAIQNSGWKIEYCIYDYKDHHPTLMDYAIRERLGYANSKVFYYLKKVSEIDDLTEQKPIKISQFSSVLKQKFRNRFTPKDRLKSYSTEYRY